MNSPLMEIKSVSKNFGGVSALYQVDYAVKENMIIGIIGPNGAGKTTLFNLITGIHRVSTGDILFKGKSVVNLPSYQIARNGIVRTFQNVKLFPNLTLLSNVMMGSFFHMRTGFISGALNLPGAIREEADFQAKALELLKFVGLEHKVNYYASALPFGQQRLLEIARALAAKPRLLLLDEPAAGLSIPEKAELSKLIKAIRDLGITVLLVEHDMGLVMNICDEIMVLEYGRKIAEGTPDAIQKDQRVIAAYLGEEAG
jgi:branched-chain amino acid transport system ATP-binding protein